MSLAGEIGKILDASTWESYGFPPLGIIDRCVYGVVAAEVRCTVSRIAEVIWGGAAHRNTAKRALERLAEHGLVECQAGRWTVEISDEADAPNSAPALNSAPPMRQIAHHPAPNSAPNKDRPALNSAGADRPSALNSAPPMRYIAQGQDAPLRYIAQEGAPNSAGTDCPSAPNSAVEEDEEEVGEEVIPTERAHVRRRAHGLSTKAREEDDEEKTSSSPYPLQTAAIARIPTSYSRWNPLDLVREAHLDPQDIPPPGPELEDWLNFAASCATWAAHQRGTIRKSPLGFRGSCLDSYRDQLEMARAAIGDALDLAEAIRSRESREASKAEAAESRRREASLDYPSPDLEADDPTLSPHAWIANRKLPESQDLERLARSQRAEMTVWRERAEGLRRESENSWSGSPRPRTQSGQAEMARHHRERYLRQVRALLDGAKADSKALRRAAAPAEEVAS